MDLSPLIFAALAVAWAVYLVPKALRHHDEVVRSRSVDKFSHTMRVLARREPVSRSNARLVLSPVRAPRRPVVETKPRATAPVETVRPRPAPTRASARRAARRRRRVLGLLVLATAVVAGLAAGRIITWPWTAIPAGLLVAWLVACRLSVRAERRARAAIHVGLPPDAVEPEPEDDELTGEIAPVPPSIPTPSPAPDESPAASPATSPARAASTAPDVISGEIPVVTAGAWDMVPTTLPTYVTKAAAQRRTVSTIDLDSTGVWTSGRHDGDSALARSAEQADKAARDDADERHASGA